MYRPMDTSLLEGTRVLDSSMLRVARPEFHPRPMDAFQGMPVARVMTGNAVSYGGGPVNRSLSSFPSVPMPSSAMDRNEMVC